MKGADNRQKPNGALDFYWNGETCPLEHIRGSRSGRSRVQFRRGKIVVAGEVSVLGSATVSRSREFSSLSCQ